MVAKMRRILTAALLVLCFFVGIRLNTFAMQSPMQSDSPFVSFSPDGMAFTTNAGDKSGTWYSYGTSQGAEGEKTLADLETGEHYYRYQREGTIPISSWQVRHVAGQCIHNHYNDTNHYHGVAYQRNNCLRKHYSGWVPICADCGDEVTHALFYMSREAAATISHLNMAMSYYYLCPYCDNLEQGFELHSHNCLAVSANRYFVKYDAAGGSGYMPNSVHMYGNATMYEGQEVRAAETLTLNAYTKWGYEFVGWTQNPDGSGAFYEDGAQIYNLTENEGEVITLYAKWRPSESMLHLHTAGGKYDGKEGVLALPGRFGETKRLEKERVEPPKGYTVRFDSMQGEQVPSLEAEKYVSSFQIRTPFKGIWKEGVYAYPPADGSEDHIEICYGVEAVTLPGATREGYVFGGWYYDEACTEVAGSAGCDFTPTKDVCLYAGWTTLYLETKESRTANDGKGAVDLSWEMKSSEGKTYKVYQKKEGEEFLLVGDGIAIGEEVSVLETFDVSGSYQIPYTGYYKVTLGGAKGEDYKEKKGGEGGLVSATMYLKKGDVLTSLLGTSGGEPGSGKGTPFGSGGGYSTLFLEGQESPVLIAGGGGGASLSEHGGNGGSSESLMETENGEEGVSGGGGGYYGGSAGVLEQHFHDDSCKHTHEGNPNTYGGCYTVKTSCGNTGFTKYEKSNTFYYGNKVWDPVQKKYVSCFCPRCGSYSCPGHRDRTYGYRCNRCSTTYSYQPSACSAQTGYTIGCGRDESYLCGFEEGQVLRSVPSFGGSSYADLQVCLGAVFEVGGNDRNGTLTVESIRLGFHHEKSIPGVPATDEAPPQQIAMSSVELCPEGNDEIWVRFARPKDRGTTYYHKVEAYDSCMETYVCTSNHTKNTLISGIVGYYYALDGRPDTKMVGTENFYEDSGSYPKLKVPVTDTLQYLHVAAVDQAGNIAETTHIKVSDTEEILWPVYTGELTIEEGPGVWETAEKTYYVKADGNYRINLSFGGSMVGIPRENYQITEGVLHSLMSDSEGSIVTKIPRLVPIKNGVHVYDGMHLATSYEGECIFADGGYLTASRFGNARNLTLTRGITLAKSQHGKKIFVYPQVKAKHEKGYTTSEYERDVTNGIWLLADGEGPHISGMESLNGLELLDRTIQEEFTIVLRATDEDAGLAYFEVRIWNADNFGEKTWEDTDGDGEIRITLPLTESIVNGRFSLLAKAVDHVGNVSTCDYRMTGYYLYAGIERCLSPTEPVFQAGESGKLAITAGGYVDKLVVIFPSELSSLDGSLDREFVYEVSMYEQREEFLFMVPLYAKEGEYKVKVQAYKDGTRVEDYPVWVPFTVKGSVLDDFRTRLR